MSKFNWNPLRWDWCTHPPYCWFSPLKFWLGFLSALVWVIYLWKCNLFHDAWYDSRWDQVCLLWSRFFELSVWFWSMMSLLWIIFSPYRATICANLHLSNFHMGQIWRHFAKLLNKYMLDSPAHHCINILSISDFVKLSLILCVILNKQLCISFVLNRRGYNHVPAHKVPVRTFDNFPAKRTGQTHGFLSQILFNDRAFA